MECRPHWEFFFFFLVHSKSDYMEFWGKKWACTPFCHADSLLACYATSQIFIEHILIFSPPPPPLFLKLFSFVNNFLVLFFKPPFFDLWSNQRGFGPKNTSRGAFNLLCQADLILACHTWFLILVNMIQSMIHNLIYDLIHDPICDLIWSDPDFVYATLDTINEVQFYH